jgi:uncharacterized protein YbjT (DUF2867 family)
MKTSFLPIQEYAEPWCTRCMTNSHSSTPMYAVIGGTGKSGRRVADALATRSVAVRRLSRSTSPGFDWADGGTWRDALAGAAGVYIATPEIADPAAARGLRSLGAELTALGIDRVVLLSGRREQGAAAAEAALRERVPTATVLRSAFFMQNFDEGYFAPQVAAGWFGVPVPEVREPFVDAADLAEVAAVALLEDGHAGRTYEITGPESLSMHEVAAALSRLDRPVRFVAQTPSQYEETLVAAGLPAAEAAATAGLFALLLDGRNSAVVTDIPRLLGRRARSFAEYLHHAHDVTPATNTGSDSGRSPSSASVRSAAR